MAKFESPEIHGGMGQIFQLSLNAKIIKDFLYITSKNINFWFIPTFPNLLYTKMCILQPFENLNFSMKNLSRPFFVGFFEAKIASKTKLNMIKTSKMALNDCNI